MRTVWKYIQYLAQPTSEKWLENFSMIASTVGIEELENETLLNIAVGTSVTFESAVILLGLGYKYKEIDFNDMNDVFLISYKLDCTLLHNIIIPWLSLTEFMKCIFGPD